jgi:hypothetical protein
MRARSCLGRLGIGVVLALTLAGCGADEAGEEVDDPTSVTESTEPTEATEPTEPTEPEAASPTTEPADSNDPTQPAPSPTSGPTAEPSDGPTSPRNGPRAALLTADTMPAPGDAAWESVRTQRGTGTGGISLCQVTELDSLGATGGAVRRFRTGTVTSTQVVAQFVDEQGATQAYDVLQAWLGRCAGQGATKGFDRVEAPTGYTPVRAGAQSGWALLLYGPVPRDPDAAFFEAQSLVRLGDTLSWVVWTQIGEDYNYAPGQTPPEQAIPLLVDALGGA